jgi:glycosyltransferase involved in cell wall biosynthesis
MLSFIFITCRKEPKFEWFVDSLYNQVVENSFDPSKIQIVLVDFDLQYDESRKEKYQTMVGDRFNFVHVPPKPSPVQGPYKVTSKNYFSASNARNTGVCYAKNPYLLFIDDTSVMIPGSFPHIIEYATKNIIVGFAYKKVFDLDVDKGIIKSVRETSGGFDTRWNQGSDFREICGSQLYGYNAGPLNIFLSVNGYDEINDTHGYEDLHYGIRLKKSNNKIYYSRRVVFLESEELAEQGNSFTRRDPLLTDLQYNGLLRLYKVPKRWDQNGRKDISHFLLDLLMRDKTWTEGNDYHLTELRNKILSGGEFTIEFDKERKLLDGIKLCDL